MPYLRGDVTRFQQVLINLVRNALKFTHIGKIEVIVNYDETQQAVVVSCKDTGIGIKQSDIENLFTLFGKLQRSADLNSEGLGLGLRICKQIVEQNGGKIYVESAGENKGSCFTFSMKMEEVDTNSESLLE